MKKIQIILLLLFFVNISISQTFEIYKGDTINYTDKNNLKQGTWIFFNENYTNKIAQIGYYKDNKKDGLWTGYYKNGTTKTAINFKDNKQYGSIKIYYPDGTIQENGYWKLNKWVGEYTYYYANGEIKYHWFFDDSGKRSGQQQYYYDNGQVQIEGNWTQGKESGKIIEYYDNGVTKKVCNYDNGALNGSFTEYYSDGQLKIKSVYVNGVSDPNQSFAYQQRINNNQNNNNNNSTDQDTNQTDQPRVFSGTGYFKLVNSDGLVEREGDFINGILIEGKRYFYDDDNNLIKTAIIQDGRIVKYE